MNTDLIRFRRRTNDPVMIEYISELFEDEINDHHPCDYNRWEGWVRDILDGTTNRVIREYTYDGLFSEGAYFNEELFEFIRKYLSNAYLDRINFNYETGRIDCGDDDDYYSSFLYGVDNNQ